MKHLVAILSCLAFVSGVFAQDAPKGPPPIFKVVTSVDAAKGQIQFKETVTKVVPVQKEIDVNVNGQIMKQVITEYVSVLEERSYVVEVANARVITPDGKKIANDDIWKRVKAKNVVVLSANGDTPAAEYLRALHPETVVIIPAPVKN
jgi:hypothetical protein